MATGDLLGYSFPNQALSDPYNNLLYDLPYYHHEPLTQDVDHHQLTTIFSSSPNDDEDLQEFCHSKRQKIIGSCCCFCCSCNGGCSTDDHVNQLDYCYPNYPDDDNFLLKTNNCFFNGYHVNPLNYSGFSSSSSTTFSDQFLFHHEVLQKPLIYSSEEKEKPITNNGSSGSGRGEEGSSNFSAQSIAARKRRRRISDKTQELGNLIPGGNKMNTAEMFQAAFNYVKFLQAQVGILQLIRNYQESKKDEESHGNAYKGEKLLQVFLASSVIQEKLYVEERCLVPEEFVETLAKDHHETKIARPVNP